MTFVSIDIEATGLQTDIDQILEFSAIIENTKNILPFKEIPKFSYTIVHERIEGHPRALIMNAEIIKRINFYLENTHQKEVIKAQVDYQYKDVNNITAGYCLPKDLLFHFSKWLNDNGIVKEKGKDHLVITPAGKNFQSYDKLMISKLPGYGKLLVFRHRGIDPTTYFIDWENDEVPPGLGDCKKRCGLNEIISHKSLEDAWDVIQVLRSKYIKNENKEQSY